MVCYITCGIALAFIVAAIFTCIGGKKYPEQFKDTLDPNQKEIYDQIVKDRMKIYIIATIVGAILGLLYILLQRNKQSTMQLICIAVLIFFVTQIVIYMVYPKSAYMLDYITNNEQSRAWLKVYNEMMKQYFIGFVLGLIGYAILCLAFLS